MKTTFQNELNNILKGTNYSLKHISWNDVSRYNSYSSGLSCIGSNITDVKLTGKNNEEFYTIRTDNWNEKVGTVSAKDVAIIVEADQGLTPITLSKYLSDKGLSSSLDDKVSIRFQTTFLNIEDNKTSVEFCTESYSYNTPDESNPKNLLLLATTQGISLHTNKSTYQKLFLHGFDENGRLVNRWLEAEETEYKVGAEQVETEEQVLENIKKGKASSAVIGIESMGQRFNALLTVQIPLKQKDVRTRSIYNPKPVYAYNGTGFFEKNITDYENVVIPDYHDYSTYDTCNDTCNDSFDCDDEFGDVLMTLKLGKSKGSQSSMRGGVFGKSSSARVSKGSIASEKAIEVDTEKIKRSETEHITITVILYHVVKGGIPTKEDVISAVAELDNLYDSCTWSGNLKDLSKHNIIPSLVDEKIVQKTKEEIGFVNRTVFPNSV